MNATRTLRPRASSPFWVDELSAIAWAASTRWPTATIGRWLVQVPWLLRTNFRSRCPAGGRGAPALHARADDRRLGLQERHGLALHVRAHQGAVRIVVLEERDERSGHGHDLLGADVHVLDMVGARHAPPFLRSRAPPPREGPPPGGGGREGRLPPAAPPLPPPVGRLDEA